MKRHPRLAFALPIALACAMAAPAALAQTPSETPAARADRLFHEGKAALEEKRYGEACPKLAESMQLDPGTGTLLALGLCHEGAGKLASAWRELVEVVDESEKDGRSDRAKFARQHVVAIEPHLSKLTVRVANGGAPGLRVRIDGEELQRSKWGAGVPVDPGNHVVDASADGQPPWKTSVQVGPEADAQSVSLPDAMNGKAAPPPPSPPPPQSTDTEAPTPASPKTSGARIAGFVVGGVGLVAIGVGSYFGVRALNDHSDATKLCPSSPCADANGVNENGTAQTEAWVADFAIGLGVVAVGVGVYLAFIRHDEPKAPTARLVPMLGPGTGGLGVAGRW